MAQTKETEWPELMRRDLAAEYLTSKGFECSKSGLAKWAVSGDGPPYRKAKSRVYYERSALDAWLDDLLGEPHTSTAGHAFNDDDNGRKH